MSQTQTQFQTQIKLDQPILETAEDVLEMLAKITGCDAKPKFDEFETIDDIVAVLTDPDAWDEYANACLPSAQRFLQAIALMAAICYHEVPDVNMCEKFYQGLGQFIVAKDGRAFMALEDCSS
jgi:hypothetical protein